MLIDSRLPNTFQAEIIKTANYLQNRLLTKTIAYEEIIFEKIWTKKKQNLQHICIFGSLALCNIPKEKRLKSHYQKIWEEIFIGYSGDTAKHFQIWAPQTKQVIITSKLYIDKLEQKTILLKKRLISTIMSLRLKRKLSAKEPKPQKQP